MQPSDFHAGLLFVMASSTPQETDRAHPRDMLVANTPIARKDGPLLPRQQINNHHYDCRYHQSRQ
jgi:hypothetical protein